MGQHNRLKAMVMVLSLSAVLSACGKHDPLQGLDKFVLQSVAHNDVKVNFCTEPAYDQKQYLKTIIILDHSGSNQQNFKLAADGSGAPALVNGVPQISALYGTDPTGQTRYGTAATAGTLLNYLSTLPANDPADPQKFFALVDFNSKASTYPVNASGFTSDIPDFYNHVLQDSIAGGSAPDDGDATDYMSALSAAYNIMNADVQNAAKCAALAVGSASPGSWCPVPGKQTASSYVVIFMSDGSPITDISGIGVDANGNVVVTGQITITKQPATDILGQVAAMAALTSNTKFVTSVNLFTIYYYVPGNVDQSASDLLANMAKVGNGIAYNALGGSNIDYSKFQPPKKRIKFTLSDVFVTNASATYWNDGVLHADTDMDGLPDDVESAWGSDPNSAQTDKNGVLDLVKYQLSQGKACANKNAAGRCQDPVTNYSKGACAGVSRSTVNGLLTFKSSDPDGLNDCEKVLLNNNGGVNNPDSNADLIPDWLEFKNDIPFQLGTTPAVNQRDQDGYTIYQKIKWSLPLNVAADQISNFHPASYNLQLLSSTADQDCYALDVADIPTKSDNDMIRVDVVQKSELLGDTMIYRVGKKSFNGTTSVQFDDWNNAAEQAAKTWSLWP